MANLSIFLVFVIISSSYCLDHHRFKNLVSSKCPSDGDREFHFDKQLNGSEYNFKYKLDNGEIYSGKTYHVSEEIFLMFGASGILYWIEMDQEESNKTELTKIAHVAQRKDDVVLMKNDHYVFHLNYTEDLLEQIPYHTKWNSDHICFSRKNSEDQTFNFTMPSLNNSRKYNGTTYLETDDPLVQRIHIKDGTKHNGVYEIKFTEVDLTCNGTFCRGITNLIFESWKLGIGHVHNVNPELLASLSRLYSVNKSKGSQ